MKRPNLLWLGVLFVPFVPFVLFCVVLPLVNRVEPRIAGVPFLLVWLAVATLVTPLAVWLARRGDRR
ncbi:DUF3311 domain-containing protein [Streptomyces subrutilus]|uniref:DUF3311 domain-containing protein n=1 Tax=Streptomyces subrutilus TaxID=36818 RepID=A0A5P2USG3_9ACTN|nr:DUF3311 domain-containing protein [Streptomyces subrutilus]QEU80444.1 DUF3311 domain-containing protein [Streptomyces subrutilus]WSJ30259.1 DUF3311 domain-containing protein [Streptomyces subrutilus]GGZ75445.1 hypothetical protein GCM10010371_39050 [Streptomyces subrutilus]